MYWYDRFYVCLNNKCNVSFSNFQVIVKEILNQKLGQGKDIGKFFVLFGN